MKGKSSNAKQGARQGQALSRMMVVDARSFCATATSAQDSMNDGADLITTVLTCSRWAKTWVGSASLHGARRCCHVEKVRRRYMAAEERRLGDWLSSR